MNARARVLLASLMLASASPGATSTGSTETPRIIRVVLDDAYAPYSFRSATGELQGVLVDQWRAWEKKTGVGVELHAMAWGDALRRMREGEFDVIDNIVETAERRSYFDFTPSYATIKTPIFFRNDISGIVDLASLKGFSVGVKTGDQHIEQLTANGVMSIIPFQNNDAIVAAAKQHHIGVFIADAPSAIYLLNKEGIEPEFRRSAPVFQDELKRAVRRGDAALLRTVTGGFAAIDPAELKRIDEKWFGRAIDRTRRYLSYVSYAAAAGLLLISVLAGWNRTLRKKVLLRTAALAESEQRFRQIAENIREVFWLTTVDLDKVLYVSPAYEEVWGRSRESVYRDSRSFIAAIHPEDRPRVIGALEHDRAVGFELEYRVVRPDGSIRWIRDRGFPIKNEAAHAYRTAGIAEDITERKLAAEAVKKAEDHVRVIIDTIPTMAWSVRPDGAVDFVNQRWLDYTGLSLEQEIENPTGVVHPEDLPGALEKWTADMSRGKLGEDEMRLRGADGSYRWFLVRTAPLRDEAGNIVKWFGSSFDIEDRKQANEALRRSEQQLHSLVGRLHTAREDEAKRIARELHDELGQRLTALNMELAHFEANLAGVTPDQREQIKRMHSVVDHTVGVVQELAGELRLGQLDVLGLTAAIDWQLKEFARRSGICCNVTRLDEITDLSDAQGTAVFRILQEALTNVVRHASATQVEVSLQAGADRVALKVHDNGRGITAAELNDHGAIGLLGMRERAQLVGGDVTITGETGEGTQVLVRIPRRSLHGAPA
ncbi:MAG: domain S-box-containing protein [Verrucomicrobia bacterium]|nr:domain S-box-containing protein [Verrucomicrobiota bacterium]